MAQGLGSSVRFEIAFKTHTWPPTTSGIPSLRGIWTRALKSLRHPPTPLPASFLTARASFLALAHIQSLHAFISEWEPKLAAIPLRRSRPDYLRNRHGPQEILAENRHPDTPVVPRESGGLRQFMYFCILRHIESGGIRHGTFGPAQASVNRTNAGNSPVFAQEGKSPCPHTGYALARRLTPCLRRPPHLTGYSDVDGMAAAS